LYNLYSLIINLKICFDFEKNLQQTKCSQNNIKKKREEKQKSVEIKTEKTNLDTFNFKNMSEIITFLIFQTIMWLLFF